jgi:SAM-dependent methyltransferase
MKTHYDQNYFEWQKSVGRFSAESCAFIYSPYILPGDVVLDFGCGGGFMLANLICTKKLGVEINPFARNEAKANGIEVFECVEAVPESSVDIVISNHALEHVHDPLSELRKIRRALRPGGRLVLVTPFERIARWQPGDINQHLYTWSPLNLGNLVSLAGFEVESAEIINHRFPPFAMRLRRALGKMVFHAACLIWGRVYWPITQVRVVATVKNAPSMENNARLL